MRGYDLQAMSLTVNQLVVGSPQLSELVCEMTDYGV